MTLKPQSSWVVRWEESPTSPLLVSSGIAFLGGAVSSIWRIKKASCKVFDHYNKHQQL